MSSKLDAHSNRSSLRRLLTPAISVHRNVCGTGFRDASNKKEKWEIDGEVVAVHDEAEATNTGMGWANSPILSKV